MFSAGIPAAGNRPFASNDDESITQQGPAPAGPPAGAAECVEPSTEKLGHTYVHFVNTDKVYNKYLSTTTPSKHASTHTASTASVSYITKFNSSPTFNRSTTHYSYSSVAFPLCLTFHKRHHSAPTVQRQTNHEYHLPGLMQICAYITAGRQAYPVQ